MEDSELLCTTIHVHLGIGAMALTRLCLLSGKRVSIFEIRGTSLTSGVAVPVSDSSDSSPVFQQRAIMVMGRIIFYAMALRKVSTVVDDREISQHS